jgi:16S rRNA (uracil1498-N3)-methyltransferase
MSFMKIHRFLINQKIENLEKLSEIIITDRELNHQFKNVLRLSAGEAIVLIDGVGGVIYAKTVFVSNKESVFKIEKVEYKNIKDIVKHSVKLAPAILKKDKYEFVIQKLTELGVNEIHPIVSNRTEKLNLNFDRLNKIIKEAVEQSERFFIPTLCETSKLKDKLENLKDKNLNIFYLDMGPDKINFSLISKIKEKDVFIFIGPEGGWSEDDLKLFKDFEVKPLSFGENVLRAETASIAIASILMI